MRWQEVTQAAAKHGLAGSLPDVGVVGYTLGGGVSWLGRRRPWLRRERGRFGTNAEASGGSAWARSRR